MDEIYMTNWL